MTTETLTTDLSHRVLNALTDGVLMLDAEWNVVCFNRAAEALLGIEREEVVGQRFTSLACLSACEFRPLIERAMETRQAIVEAPVRVIAPDKRILPVSLSVAPILDETGRFEGVVATFRDVSDLELLRKELRGEYTFGDIVSRSPAIRRILNILPDAARSDSTILVTGPSGTGKELIARAIHHLSDRRDAPFVAVNCGALPDTLLESELFGYEKGAFTDARRAKPGRFALAQGGSLFLDEIGDISTAMQVKLLRVLQERQYEPLGATQSVQADVRILAATNRDLSALVRAGQFRTDLYYRLNVMELRLPPLSARREDIPLLVEHFLRKFNAQKGRSIRRISRAALGRLMRHDYPGNIRELENIVEHAFILCQADEIQEGCLPQYVLEQAKPVCEEPDGASAPTLARPADSAQERALIETTLARYGGHRSKTAQALGINTSTLWRKMKKFGLTALAHGANERVGGGY